MKVSQQFVKIVDVVIVSSFQMYKCLVPKYYLDLLLEILVNLKLWGFFFISSV